MRGNMYRRLQESRVVGLLLEDGIITRAVALRLLAIVAGRVCFVALDIAQNVRFNAHFDTCLFSNKRNEKTRSRNKKVNRHIKTTPGGRGML